MYACIYVNAEEKLWLPGMRQYFLKATYSCEYYYYAGASSECRC